jgi:hypothetical protein
MFKPVLLMNEFSGDSGASASDTSGISSDEGMINEDSGDIDGSGDELPSESDIDADPTLSKQEKTQVKKQLRELKLKFNGKEYVEKLPFDLPEDAEEYMRRHLQMSKLSQVKAQEQAQLEREVSAFFQELRSNPKKALSNPDFGVDIKKLAAEILEEELENAQKSPEQIEKERLEARLRELEEERRLEREEREQSEREAILEREYERYNSMMVDALDQYSIPNTPYAVKKMAEYMAASVKTGEQPDMEVIAEIVMNEMRGDLDKIVKSMPAEELEKFLGEEVLNSLRKSRLAKNKPAQKPAPSPKSSVKDVSSGRKEEAPKQTVNYKNFFGV